MYERILHKEFAWIADIGGLVVKILHFVQYLLFEDGLIMCYRTKIK